MLKLLQPGIQPLGQFDVEDTVVAGITGGEVGIFEALLATEGYASDVWSVGPRVQITTGTATAGLIHGLIDEGTSSGGPDASSGYGTMYGTVIGTATGQGTGVGVMSTTGVVVVGPHTTSGSGKATLWTKPGLYGVTTEACFDAAGFTALQTVNTKTYGTASTGKLDDAVTGVQVACSVGPVQDISLVSTTNRAAGGTPDTTFVALYLLGVSV